MKIPSSISIKSCLLVLTVGTALCLPLSAAPETPAAEGKPKAEKKIEPKQQKKRHPRPPGVKAPEPEKSPPTHPRRKTVKRTWLGVSMAPVPAALREHLELTEGFGIQVQGVVGDSPAQKAGLRNNDILTRLDDQILTTPEHLSILIKSKKVGDKVTLGFIRKGKDQTLDLTLGEHEMPAGTVVGSNFHHGGPRFRDHPGAGPFPPIPPYMQSKEWQEAMKRHQDQWRKMVEKGQVGRSPHSCPKGQEQCPKKGSSPDCPLLESPKAGACPKCPLQKTDTKKTAKPPAISVRPGFPLKIFGSVGIVKIDNEEGELTLTQDGDSYAMVIKDKEGKEVFSGPYNTEKGVAGLPREAKAQLKKMKLADLDVILPKKALKIKVTPGKEGSTDKENTKPGDIL